MEAIIKAIANYFNAKAEKVRAETKMPHAHSWELVEKSNFGSRLNPSYKWNEYLYRCTGCCEAKTVKLDS